ncbi:MAG: hypothetical protein EBU88_18470, partial [Acidobacteria bacterium]|nr:hypothetical protein [Acidobacteriota bacterium]
LGSRLATAAGLALFSLFTGATLPLGVALVLGLGGGYLGSVYGDDLFTLVASGIANFHDQMLNRLRYLFGQAERHVSPLVLDLDGNGIETLSLMDGCRYFDHDGNRFAERTGWVGAKDGLLIRDLDGNGLIEAGNELFGNQTLIRNGVRASDGFDALASLDLDGNGLVNAADQDWSSLAVWVDSNSSATVDPGELQTLQSLGIQALRLSYQADTMVDAQGNRHLQIGSYLLSDGRERAMHDVWFAIDHASSVDLHAHSVNPQLARIPTIPGSGVVPELRQAVARDSSGRLGSLLQQWVKGNDRERSQVLDDIIFTWTDVISNPISSLPFLEPSYQQKLAALERVLGRPYRDGIQYRNITANGVAFLGQAFAELRNYISIMLTAQTELPLLLRGVQHIMDPVTGTQHLDATNAVNWLTSCF